MPIPRIQTFVLGPYETNCSIVSVSGNDSCWIVDCGFDPAELLDAVESQTLKPAAILLTHTHLDHIAGVDEALKRFGRVPIHVHEAERGFCSDPYLNLSALAGMPITCTEPDQILRDGQTLELAGTTWRVVHTPGHSPGGVCFIHDQSRQALVGDTLFASGVGRTDFPTSDPNAMRQTLQKMMQWPDDMAIHPGHGPSTTIGQERRNNPFILNDV